MYLYTVITVIFTDIFNKNFQFCSIILWKCTLAISSTTLFFTANRYLGLHVKKSNFQKKWVDTFYKQRQKLRKSKKARLSWDRLPRNVWDEIKQSSSDELVQSSQGTSICSITSGFFCNLNRYVWWIKHARQN